MKGLVELIKSIAKVVFLTGIVIGFMWFILPNVIYLSAGLNQSLEILYRSSIDIHLYYGAVIIRYRFRRLLMEQAYMDGKTKNVASRLER